MKRSRYLAAMGLFTALAFLAAAAFGAGTGQDADRKQADKDDGKKTVAGRTAQADTSPVDRPVYKPPLRGSPAGRVGGGTRGATERESFSLMVLAPDHVGLTVSDQPVLYWFISKAIPYTVEFTLIERNTVSPLVEKDLKRPVEAGIQAVRLSDCGVRLRKGAQYKWFVTIVTDPEHRSKDILAGGIISLADAPAGLDAKLREKGIANVAWVYADEGLWYDALGSLSAMIDKAPGDAGLRRERASLLEQVGLNEAAQFEKSR